MKILLFFVCCVLVSSFALARPQSSAKTAPSSNVPVMDGGAGSCSLELTVESPDGKPVYGATVKVHINYGFGGFHKLDLQAGTNSDGKVKFTGLPVRVHQPPLEFQASKGDLVGVAEYDPAVECQAKHEIALGKAKPPETQ
jgi:hypothetical protein